MTRLRIGRRWFVIGLIALTGALPPLLYWLSIGCVPTVAAEEAVEALSRDSSTAELVDVRTPEEYAAGHLEGACSWPYAEIVALGSGDAVPAELAGKRLFLTCEGGILSALATRRLRELSVENVNNVHGGMPAFVRAGAPHRTSAVRHIRTASGETEPLPYRSSSVHEQWAAVISGFVVKPLYMLLAFAMALILRRSKTADLIALRWGLVFFFIGEAACAVNYLVFDETSFLAEYLHSFGMVLCFGFATYALFEGMDLRLIRYSDREKKCAALKLCRACYKYTDAACGLERLFLVAIAATLILAFFPLVANTRMVAYNTSILGTPYHHSHAEIHQIFQFRYCPVVAAVLLALSFLVLWRGKRDPVPWAKILFAAGAGFLVFGLFRLVLFTPFQNNLVWFDFWEEVTELIFIVGAGAVLWYFRPGLFPAAAASSGSSAS